MIDPESFTGKIYLLIADKLILGALIAAAFVAYDRWKTQETRRYEEAVQRAQYLKELVPIVVNSESDVLVRAQALVALIDRKAIDPRTAFVLTERLLRSGLMFSDLPHDEGGVYLRSHEEHFLSDALLSFMPSGLPALLNHYLVSSFPGSMDYEQKRLAGGVEADTWRYRKEAPLFWEEVLSKTLNSYPDSQLTMLDDDSFLAQYLWVLRRAARNPSLRLSGRQRKGLHILHSINVLDRPTEASGVDPTLVTRLQQEESRYLLSLISCSMSEDRRHVVDDVVRFLQELQGRKEAADLATRMTQAIGKCG